MHFCYMMFGNGNILYFFLNAIEMLVVFRILRFCVRLDIQLSSGTRIYWVLKPADMIVENRLITKLE